MPEAQIKDSFKELGLVKRRIPVLEGIVRE